MNHKLNKITKATLAIILLFIMAVILSGCNTDISKPEVGKVSADEPLTEQVVNEDQDVSEETQANQDDNADKNAKPAEKTPAASKSNLSGMTVHFIEVGQADAALIQYDNYSILIDSGDWNGNETVAYLKKQGVEKLDLIVGSHPHSDHIGQFDKVMENFKVDEAWMTGGVATTQVFERVITAIETKNVGYEEPRTGDTYEMGDLKIDILSPKSITGNLNDDSIVMKLTYGDVSFLFTGDAEKPAEAKMVSSGSDLSATILKTGHHGSDTSTTQAFLDKVNPEVAIISVSEKSRYNHPNKTVLDRLNAFGLDLYATKTHGNIVINTDGKTYNISKDRDGTITAGDTGDKAPKKDPSETEDANVSKPVDKATPTEGCIDINKASDGELQGIKHIGPATSPKVVAERPFAEVGELTKVKGLGGKKVADIKAEGKACVK